LRLETAFDGGDEQIVVKRLGDEPVPGVCIRFSVSADKEHGEGGAFELEKFCELYAVDARKADVGDDKIRGVAGGDLKSGLSVDRGNDADRKIRQYPAHHSQDGRFIVDDQYSSQVKLRGEMLSLSVTARRA
jgi:hypothetical protein